jgi:BASS family bile acid:Na+ symporter
MSLKTAVQKLLSSFALMVSLAIIAGLLLGGFPAYTGEISTVSLMVAMTFSLIPVRLRDIELRREGRRMALPFFLSFVWLSGLAVVLGMLFQPPIRYGFVAMAAVPPAVAVVPITRVVGGDVEFSLVSLSMLYLVSLALTPLIIFLFAGEAIDLWKVVRTVMLLIMLPLLLSRGARRLPLTRRQTTMLSNICFFVLMFGIVGARRSFLFHERTLMLAIAGAVALRTFGSGILVKTVGKRAGVPRETLLPLSLFGSFKNEGLAILIALPLFGETASIPLVVAILFEMLWVGCLEARLI